MAERSIMVSSEVAEEQRLSFLRLLAVPLRHHRLLVGFPLVAAVTAGVLSFVFGREYLAESKFMPQGQQTQASRVVGLATQLGLNVSGLADEGESALFYAELVRSQDILADAVRTPFRMRAGRDSATVTLMDVYKVSSQDSLARIRKGINKLRKDVSASVAARTNVVTLSTVAKTPELAIQLNRRLLALLSAFNQETRQSKASSERKFVENRLEGLRKELRGAEDTLQQFYNRNHNYRSAPELVFQEMRLRSRVMLLQQVQASLSQSYEEARIQEVRDTPVITIVQGPELALRRTGRPAYVAAIALVMAFILAVGFSFILEFFAREAAEHPAEVAEVKTLGRAAWGSLLRFGGRRN
jgi:uncharacterized protein involved in exopolysaccharide biosynthesis